jgi:hypothetical protein
VTFTGKIRLDSGRLSVETANSFATAADRDSWLGTVDLTTIAAVNAAVASTDTSVLIQCLTAAGGPFVKSGAAMLATSGPNALAYDRTTRSTPPIIVLQGGQSQMVGSNLLSDVPGGYPVLPARIANFKNSFTFACPAVDPIDDNTNQVDAVSLDTTPDVGPGLAMCDRITDPAHGNRPNQCILVPCAKGATKIEQWIPTSNHSDRATLYGSMLNRARQIQSIMGSPITVLIWQQGQSNAVNVGDSNNYQTNTQAMFDALRSDLNLPNLPIILGEMPVTPIAGYSAADWATVRAAQAAMNNPGNHQFTLVEPDGPYSSDPGHFSTATQIIVGHSFADIYLANY